MKLLILHSNIHDINDIVAAITKWLVYNMQGLHNNNEDNDVSLKRT